MSARIDHAVSSGTFSLDGETFEVDNNIWVIGDDHECVVIDAPQAAIDAIVARHTIVRQLLDNEWLHLWRMDDAGLQRWVHGQWHGLEALQ